MSTPKVTVARPITASSYAGPDAEATIVIDSDDIVTGPQPHVNTDMVVTYSISRTLKWLTAFDIFISFIYCLYNPWFFITLMLAFTGYVGSTKYSKWCSATYMCYILLNSFTRLGIFLYLFSELSGTERQYHVFDFLLVLLGTVISIWISKLICRFITYIDKLSPEQKQMLVENRIGTERRVVVLW